MKIKGIFLHNLGLKFLALLLALVTWLYVGEVNKKDNERTVLQRILMLSNYTTKKMYIKPIFVGTVPEGYEFVESGISVTPPFIMVTGPSKVLEKKEFVYTKAIDLGEYTKSKEIEIGLENISPSIRLRNIKIKVNLTIAKKNSTGG